MPAGHGGEFRRAGTAAGPQSSAGAYTPTHDPGVRILTIQYYYYENRLNYALRKKKF